MGQTLRILHVINSTDPRGGGPIEAIFQAARALAGLGHESEIVCVDDPGAPWLPSMPIPTSALGPASPRYRYTSRLEPWLRENLERFDCAIVHGIWLYPSYAVWRTSRPADKPYFIYTHGLLDRTHRRVFPARHLKKMAVWALRERRVLRDATAVLFTCEEERRLAQDTFWPRLGLRHAAIAPYCVAEPPGDAVRQARAFLDRFPHLKNRRRVLFLSRLHPKKGCDLLLHAFAKAASQDENLALVMAGPGEEDYTAMLRRLTDRLQIASRVTWTGMLRDDLKWGAFRTAEVFVLPSHQENFGIAVVEALACGCPVLITDRINLWPEVEKHKAGWVGADTVESCTAHLARWAAASAAERAALAQASRRCFEEAFSSERAAERLLDVLRAHGVGAARVFAASEM